jgi:signal transduction histidine kinase
MKKNNDEKVLIMHAEISSNKGLTNNGNQDKEVSSMVTAIVKNSEMFFSDLSTYLEFSKKVTFFVKQEDVIEDNIFRILRKVHTFKGVFDQYNMYGTVRGINEIENELFNMLHNTENLSNDQLSKLLIGYDLEGILRTDMMMLKHQLGERFFESKKKISVDIVSFERVYLSLVETLGKDHELLKEIEALKQVDIREILASYEEYVLRIAKDQGKLIKFNVTGDRVKVDRYELVHFFESLIHILKNSVTHGVEYPDERADAGKDNFATITCHVRVVKNLIHLSISDDGRGIDVKEIKNRLFILGKYSIEEIDALSDEVVCNMVIEDGVTSYALPNAIAGRGVGMGSVKETVEEIGGQISIDSIRGSGVNYNIQLPLHIEFSIDLMKSTDIRENICLQTERLLTKSEKKSTLSSTWHINEGKISSEVFKDITAFVIIKGQIDRKIAVSADEKFIYQLLNTYGLQVKYNGSNMKVMNEVMNMFVEDIVFKSVEELKGNRQNISITPSCIMSNHMFEEQCEGHDGQHAHLGIAEGNMSILVIDGQLR